MSSYNGNALYGKKWAVCGDSFTAGVTGTLIREGRFKGQNIAYPYLIAERNNMELFCFFMGGRTIAFPADGTFHNSLTDPEADCYYRNIPEDVDYITIYPLHRYERRPLHSGHDPLHEPGHRRGS